MILTPREYALLEDELELAATSSTAIVLSPDEYEPPLDSNNGKRWLTKTQRRKLARILAADKAKFEDPLPARAVRRRQMAEHGAPALGCSKREAWTLYQLTKGA